MEKIKQIAVGQQMDQRRNQEKFKKKYLRQMTM